MTGEQFLMLPGPTPLPNRIIRAMSRPLINHRGPEFKKILLEVTEGVKEICQTKHHVLIYPSSGTGGLEAAVVNFISPGDKVLAVSIGVFGDRFASIAKKFGAEVEKMDFTWGEAADPEIIGERLKKDINREIKAVLITHNETSTGVFNDLKAIKEAAGNHPALFLVDAVSGLAAVDLKMDEWGIDVVVSGSQKAFMVPPGLCFLAFNDRAYEAYKKSKSPKFYWDIDLGLEYLAKGQNPVTPPISIYYGMQEALKMMKEEGLENILKRHKNYRDMVRESIKSVGLKLLANDENASTAGTSVIAPEGIGANKIRQYMLEKFNIVLAGGQQSLNDVIFRIGHLGYVRELDLLAVIAALEITLKELGFAFDMGAGVRKAQEFLLNNYKG
ncbi:alanine--glyoxylate aminotransferase family protein [Thermosyntropha sp.]|uniref:pyridoxal-phosphate-dependent aminotransferase family protein n=1 Tax=Thermosyntropha sp. TaxID=2740820 RepID=UPI0025EF92FC|nr:alanine--glyoxylate aminotransferase family protein [Thermosyntropha sp.]MBO8159987.1 alanine--glyoxylate aminotransferase family protein [Thermosyntropha sp.]